MSLLGIFSFHFRFDGQICLNYVVQEDDEVATVAHRGITKDFLYHLGVIFTERVHTILIGKELQHEFCSIEIRLGVLAIIIGIVDFSSGYLGVILEVCPVDVGKFLEAAHNNSVVKHEVQLPFDIHLRNEADLVIKLLLETVDEVHGEARSDAVHNHLVDALEYLAKRVRFLLFQHLVLLDAQMDESNARIAQLLCNLLEILLIRGVHTSANQVVNASANIHRECLHIIPHDSIFVFIGSSWIGLVLEQTVAARVNKLAMTSHDLRVLATFRGVVHVF